MNKETLILNLSYLLYFVLGILIAKAHSSMKRCNKVKEYNLEKCLPREAIKNKMNVRVN